MKHLVFGLITVVLLLNSCGHRGGGQVVSCNEKPDSVMRLHYARGFEVSYFSGYTRVVVFNPWINQEIMARYYLYREDSCSLPKDGLQIRIPLNSLAIASCTHVAFLDLLDELELIRGVCNASMVYNPRMTEALKKGEAADLGDAFRINREKLLQIRPQALMVSGYNQYDEHLEAISRAGVFVIYNNEWMEQNLLARAEWLRYVACFLDKDKLADSLFRQTAVNYLYLKELATKAQSPNPVVMPGDNFRGSWYMPGGLSHQAQLFRDAGASYFFENDSTIGSIARSFEQVVKDFNQADIWIGASNARSLNALLALDERYAWFRSVQNKQVYAYQGRLTADGANDYWESAVVHPDSLLADFIKLFHPELLPGHKWIYINQLQ